MKATVRFVAVSKARDSREVERIVVIDSRPRRQFQKLESSDRADLRKKTSARLSRSKRPRGRGTNASRMENDAGPDSDRGVFSEEEVCQTRLAPYTFVMPKNARARDVERNGLGDEIG